jgi:peptidoglycan/LPS O-acetylase OafA/YrhL
MFGDSEDALLPPLKQTMANLSASSRIPELDGLRGLAVTSVVAFHYSLLGPPPTDHPIGAEHFYAWWRGGAALGWSGVDLFFVLSGFLIGGILLDARDSPSYYKTFYARRFFRILPLYYLWIFGYLFLMFTMRGLLTVFLRDPVERAVDGGVFWLFAFVQNVTYAGYATLGWAWLSPTWSLAVEEQFYVISPLLIRRLTKRALAVTMCSVVLLAPLARLWVHFHLPTYSVNLDLAYTLLPCRADALAIGVLMALLWRNQSFRKWLSEHAKTLYVLTAVFLGGAIGLGVWSANAFTLPMESVGYSWLALLYALILLLALQKPSGPVASLCRIGWLCEIGRISYCIYLIHGAVGWFFHALLHAVEPSPSVWEYAASSCVAAIVVYSVARASWKDIESPLLRRAQAYQY